MIGLSLRGALKIKMEEAGNGRDYSIHRESGTYRFYLLPAPLGTKSIWDVLLKRKANESRTLN